MRGVGQQRAGCYTPRRLSGISGVAVEVVCLCVRLRRHYVCVHGRYSGTRTRARGGRGNGEHHDAVGVPQDVGPHVCPVTTEVGAHDRQRFFVERGPANSQSVAGAARDYGLRSTDRSTTQRVRMKPGCPDISASVVALSSDSFRAIIYHRYFEMTSLQRFRQCIGNVLFRVSAAVHVRRWVIPISVEIRRSDWKNTSIFDALQCEAGVY